MAETQGKITWDEIANKFPSVMALVVNIQKAVADAQLDGKLSGEELGGVIAIAAPALGKLVDEVIADAND